MSSSSSSSSSSSQCCVEVSLICREDIWSLIGVNPDGSTNSDTATPIGCSPFSILFENGVANIIGRILIDENPDFDCSSSSSSVSSSSSYNTEGCCPDVENTETVFATRIATTGDCDCTPEAVILTKSITFPFTWDHIDEGPGDCADIDLHLRCEDGVWRASSQELGSGEITASESNCSPFSIVVTLTTNPNNPNAVCQGTVTYEFTT